MELVVTPAALACFREEWAFEDGEQIRIFVRYVSGGETPFALGITRDTPQEAGLIASAGPLTFYMESKDVWFLEGNPLLVDCEGEDIVFRIGSR
ncbi:HesB/YadR/YfhF family protein [Cohnella candidum]|uniref:Fe-S cluster assembly protein HesB n=1 Tax=Cohnella candidum TaxID=2674991 RepID=A0A3G3K0I0_9BACL|nr:Fe-S cluster assembly protein HesB [Cohnella candidum]AYQ73617.1 Fe-S cluster assembly protein HesB [Cohnella candidum]